MTFDPDFHVQDQRDHYLDLAKSPAFRDHAIVQLEAMAREEHGMWAPLAEVAKALKQSTPRAGRASNQRRSA